MLLWLLIVILATLVGGVLLLAARSKTRAVKDAANATEQHFAAQLNEIETDLQMGRLSETEADTARTELARELVRFRTEKSAQDISTDRKNSGYLAIAAFGVPLLAVGIYAFVGQPEMPAQPLSSRPPEPADEISFDDALAQIEARLEQTPDDLRGWQVIAPAYMRAGRYADAETAFRRILDLSEPQADTLTDLAEAMLMQNDGIAGPEILGLLDQALSLDPGSIRARFYLAGEATRAGNWDEAIAAWQELIALADGDEPWLEVAENGLALAEARGETPDAAPESDQPSAKEQANDTDQQEMIRGMVDQLATRLAQQGGTLEEWTRLVRSRIVLGELDLAAEAYQEAVSAYPEAEGREELDELARQAGLASDE